MSVLTVIMPVYNAELYLEESIESILNQTFSDFTLILINDNSSDDSQAIIDHFTEVDPRVQCIKNNNNLGPAKSRNIAIDSVKTEFIAFMDADDKAIPTRFEKQLNFLKSNPEVGVCGSWSTFFGEKNNVLSHNVNHDEIKVGFLSHCAILNPTVLLRRASLGNLRFPEYMIVAEDYSLYSQLISITRFHNIPQSLLFYRWHPKNTSKTKIENLKSFEFEIRVKQLENLGIQPDNPNIENFINAVSLRKREANESIIKTIKSSNILKDLNRKTHYFNQSIFENHIDTTIIRTIRNAKSYDRSFYNYVKNESGYFSKIPKLDAAIMFLKSYFN